CIESNHPFGLLLAALHESLVVQGFERRPGGLGACRELTERGRHPKPVTQADYCVANGGGDSITSSARTSSDGGIVSPSAFAVQLLMTNSNRVACRSGNSLGRAPSRIFATCSAAIV